MVRLSTSTLDRLPEAIAVPGYDRSGIRTGIVHFGVGGFHRSHQAMFIDRLLTAGLGDGWGICGVGILPGDAAMRDVLTEQDNLYTLLVTHPDGRVDARVIGSIVRYLFAPDDPQAVIEALADPDTRIVSLTITEGGYGVNDATGEFEADSPGTVHDLEPGAVPETVFGLITEGLRVRRDRGIPAFTVMSCDNIQGNGAIARVALRSYAALKDPELERWIAAQVAFPNSMVDRITPVTTDQGRAEVTRRLGVVDEWPVVSESFVQWVLEDTFTLGRPPLEQVGVQLVADVEPYELMKLRLLNASHQAIGHLGLLAGFDYVHEVCQDPLFSAFLLRYMAEEAAPTLGPVPGIDLAEYQQQLLQRFASTVIQDTLARLVVDGSERIPKFLLPVIRAQLAGTGAIRLSALIVAAYSRFIEGTDDNGAALAIQDVRRDRLRDAVSREATDPGSFLRLREVFGDLGDDDRFLAAYLEARRALAVDGVVATIRRYLSVADPPVVDGPAS
ncbi:MAG: mannitol dehydrogenase family protein [Microbacteriaceae bacterium]